MVVEDYRSIVRFKADSSWARSHAPGHPLGGLLSHEIQCDIVYVAPWSRIETRAGLRVLCNHSRGSTAGTERHSFNPVPVRDTTVSSVPAGFVTTPHSCLDFIATAECIIPLGMEPGIWSVGWSPATSVGQIPGLFRSSVPLVQKHISNTAEFLPQQMKALRNWIQSDRRSCQFVLGSGYVRLVPYGFTYVPRWVSQTLPNLIQDQTSPLM